MDKINIDINEVFRYLGHKNQDISPQLINKTKGIIEKCATVLMPKNTVGRYTVAPCENGVRLLENGLVLQGSDIKKHLEDCCECYIFCATIGSGVEGLIRSLQAISVTDSLIADAAATTAIESYCDNIENDLRRRLKDEKLFLTWRYSPGYGDFPFTQQPDILSLLRAEKFTGVVCGESCIMLPRKSVTAVMGIAKSKPKEKQSKCADCPNRDNCNFSCR